MIGKLLLRSLHEMPKSAKQSRRQRGGGIQGSSWSMFVKYLHPPHNQTTCGLRQTAQCRLLLARLPLPPSTQAKSHQKHSALCSRPGKTEDHPFYTFILTLPYNTFHISPCHFGLAELRINPKNPKTSRVTIIPPSPPPRTTSPPRSATILS